MFDNSRVFDVNSGIDRMKHYRGIREQVKSMRLTDGTCLSHPARLLSDTPDATTKGHYLPIGFHLSQ